ncbi:hypothetical protein SM124_19200 [Bacillus sp. 31A1R]|uniref:Lipoprotein n=1 Tax=Robertmurraya mangrovi TaxID=3098077 RepID=A0ABU5J355_9BACI|nr:hypothetical protein [Bacillus sp. 31A1R]MDZ5473850.1 hypothetical protein [Bacillus sp. 31A1R]
MKKSLSFLLAGMLVTSVVGCSSKEEVKEEETKVEETSAEVASAEDETAKAARSALLSYQGAVQKVIRTVETALVTEGTDPVEAAATFATDVKAVAIPAELADQKADLEAAIESLTGYYTKKAELLKDKAEDTTEADSLKEEYIAKTTGVFEKLELNAPLFNTIFQ